MTLAILRLFGKMPVDSDWFMIIVSGSSTDGDIRFKIFIDRLSWPELVFGSNLFIILEMSSDVTAWKVKVCSIFLVR